MKALVSTAYKNGIRLPQNKPLPVFSGDLNVDSAKHPVLGRLEHEACLLDENGRHVIEPLIGVRLVGIYADTMVLRGVEYLTSSPA